VRSTAAVRSRPGAGGLAVPAVVAPIQPGAPVDDTATKPPSIDGKGTLINTYA